MEAGAGARTAAQRRAGLRGTSGDGGRFRLVFYSSRPPSNIESTIATGIEKKKKLDSCESQLNGVGKKTFFFFLRKFAYAYMRIANAAT